jgi:hypothetical protein
MATWTDFFVMFSATALLVVCIMLARRVVWELDEIDGDRREKER